MSDIGAIRESGAAKKCPRRAKLHCMVISCSADILAMDGRNLYVWGELDSANWLPDTKREAMRRITRCKMKHQCHICDAQIHELEIERTKEIRANL